MRQTENLELGNLPAHSQLSSMPDYNTVTSRHVNISCRCKGQSSTSSGNSGSCCQSKSSNARNSQSKSCMCNPVSVVPSKYTTCCKEQISPLERSSAECSKVVSQGCNTSHTAKLDLRLSKTHTLSSGATRSQRIDAADRIRTVPEADVAC